MHVSFYCTLLYIMQELNADCIMSESHNVQHGWCLALFAQWLVWVFIRATARTPVSVVVFVPHSEEGKDSMSRCNRYSVLMGT